MAVKFLHNDRLRGANADDEYLKRVLRYGDTTDACAQVRACRDYGVEAHFATNGNRSLLSKEIAAGFPVATGILHHGNVHCPTGGGHWMLCIGVEPDHGIFHDPYGELDNVNGGYSRVGVGGVAVHYSWKNWLPRWEADGAGTGWHMTFRPIN